MSKLSKIIKIVLKCIQDELREFYLKHFKLHCPECGGILDNVWFDMSINKNVYECRDCKNQWT